MTPIYHTRSLSASRCTTYLRCPVLYLNRYVLKLPEPPSFERDFGIAVHAGIEAHFKGLDADMAFLSTWRPLAAACRLAGVVVPNWAASRGLDLLASFQKLGLTGEPERRVGLMLAGVSVPIIGYVDLWGDGQIWDYKTTGWSHSQEWADNEVFQPAIYSQVYADEHDGALPKFTYVVMSRNTGAITMLDGTRNVRQIFDAFEQMRAIFASIEAQEWGCTCGGEKCKPREVKASGTIGIAGTSAGAPTPVRAPASATRPAGIPWSA